jgi:hypothetical protein
MARKFLTPIDLSGLELQNAVVQNLPTGSLPASPADGRVAYDSTTDQLKVAINGVWTALGTGTISDATTSSKGIVQLAGDLAGTAVAPVVAAGAITDTKVAAANKDGAVGTASMRTLGSGAQQAMPGNRTLDAIAAPVADVSLNSHKATNLLDPTTAQDAATKNYVDSVAVSNIAWKAPVRAMVTTSIGGYTYANGASGVGATLTASTNFAWPASFADGVALVQGDRVLVPSTIVTGLQSGIYVLTQVGVTGTSPWILTRATDADSPTELLQATVFVEEGGINTDTLWTQTTNAPIAVGTTALNWVNIQSGTQIGGDGTFTLRNGTNIAAVVAVADFQTPAAMVTATNGLTFTDINRLARSRKFVLKGDGSTATWPLTHNFGQRQVSVGAQQDDGSGHPAGPIEVDWLPTSDNVVTITFPTAPLAGTIYWVQIIA